jgi:hypothetical protein
MPTTLKAGSIKHYGSGVVNMVVGLSFGEIVNVVLSAIIIILLVQK